MTLIERLEKAGEGSREMDELVALETTHPYGVDAVDWDGFPAYTTSLDAALALAERVLPGWYVGVQANRYELLTTPEDWSAYLSAPKGHDFKDEVEASAATPALALCLAVLRATQEQPDV